MNKLFVLILVLFYCSDLYSQKQDRIWLFADSAGIDFNDLQNPVAISCNLGNPNSTAFASIADKEGNLLFYTGGVSLNLKPMRIFDKNGNVMQNGDTLIGYPWVCQGNMIIPFPDDTTRYYAFIANRTGSLGNLLYYSTVDMSLNGGLGSVTSRNNLLLSDYINEKLNATRHANGRDWWIVVQSTNTDSLFHKFLITPDSIWGPFDQKIGSGSNRDKFHGQMVFSKDGSKLGLVSGNSAVDIFDFDRCTGQLSNYRQVGESVSSLPNYYFGCSFSPNVNVFYASSIWYEYKNVYQYDLTAPNIQATKQLVFSYPDTGSLSKLSIGQQLLGPDDRIYIAKGNDFYGTNSNTYYTHHMDVILSPDSLGTDCNYQPTYFDLGNARTIQGLPTMVNYNLGPVAGSICDSLSTGLNDLSSNESFEVYPNPFSASVTVRTNSRQPGVLIIYDVLGSKVFEGVLTSDETIDLSSLGAGVYVVAFDVEGRRYTDRVVKIGD